MNGDGKANSQLQEVNHHLQDKSKRGEDVVVGLPQDLVDDDQMNGTKIFDDVKASCQGAVQESVVLQMPQQQSQGTTVCWERFLHLRTLRVLLVENDDCTRLVVAALLRNCSYEVTEASNGLQAWKILEDLTNHIDLVLTEVVLPCLSGIALLSKIMSHRTRKNIPVIMMSSLDPMGLVFKCLSKGAVDFLVKPIRKNELKNLWQHIWRRCHSSSGSGSESGTQTQKSIKSKRLQNPENNTGSNDEDNNGSISLNVGDESDDGSGTQSSWTKQDMEVESPRLMSPGDRVTEHPDSTCAQFIYSNAEIAGIRKVSGTAEKECQEPGEQYENVATLNMDVGHRSIDLQLENQPEAQIRPAGAKQNDQLDTGSSKFCEQIDRGQMMDLNNKSPLCNPKYEAGKFCGGIAKITDIDGQNSEYGFPNKHSKMFGMHGKAIKDSEELPFMELSLKRLRGVKDVETTIQDERNVLRRSGSSAFSRYNTVSNANKGPGVKVESASQDDNNLEVRKKGSESDIQSHSIGDPIYQSSNGGSNNMDMGSTTNNAFLKPVGLKKKSEVSSTIHCLNTSSSFKLMKNDLICGPQQVLSDKGDNLVPSPVPAQPRSTHQELQIQYLIHHYDNCHHLVHNMQQHLPHEHDQLSVKKMAEPVPHCGSSNMLGGSFEGNAGNYSVNGSASGSNHGSNGKNGSSTAVNPGEMNAESDTGAVGKGGSGDVSGSGSRSGNCGSGNRVDQNKSAQREAALTKFRQKKKERYFRKKVQYQNRKKLAERPQVQFVRQTANDSTSRGSER